MCSIIKGYMQVMFPDSLLRASKPEVYGLRHSNPEIAQIGNIYLDHRGQGQGKGFVHCVHKGSQDVCA